MRSSDCRKARIIITEKSRRVCVLAITPVPARWRPSLPNSIQEEIKLKRGFNGAVSTMTIVLAIIFLVAFAPRGASAQIVLSERFELYGNARGGYFAQYRSDRDGSDVERHELRLRARLGIGWQAAERLQVRIRYAGRFSSIGPTFEPGWTTTAVGNNGLRMGELAFDEAYLRYDLAPASHVKLGRFTTQYTLPGVIGNGLIRNDAPSSDVQWTDGAMVSHGFSSGWTADVIAQIHYGNWPTNTARYPLDYSAAESWLMLFSSVSRVWRTERLRLVGVNAALSPNALIVRPGERDHYAVVSVKTALGWRTDTVGDIVWAVEGAWSAIRPFASHMRLSGNGRVGGLGGQTVLSFLEFMPGHSVGFAAAVVEPAILTTEDYWNNSTMAEVRYSLRLTPSLSAQARLRHRGDLRQYENTVRKRSELIPYARLTYRL